MYKKEVLFDHLQPMNLKSVFPTVHFLSSNICVDLGPPTAHAADCSGPLLATWQPTLTFYWLRGGFFFLVSRFTAHLFH